MQTISDVIGKGMWRTVEDPYLRLSVLEERGRRLDKESAREVEQVRAGKEAEVRELAIRLGFVEYVPEAGESVERLELRKKALWRKQFAAYPFAQGPAKAKLMALVSRLHAKWQAEQAEKAARFAPPDPTRPGTGTLPK